MERLPAFPFAASLSRFRAFALAFFAPLRAFRDPGALLLILALTALVAAGRQRAPELAPVVGGRLDPGPVFLDGLYGPEAHADGYEFRWTSGAALVQLRGAFYAAPAYRAELRLRSENPAGPQPLTILAGGRPVATVTPETRFRTYRLLVGPTPEAGAELWLALHTPTFEAPVNPRRLGVILTDVTLSPVARPGLAGATWAAAGTFALLAALWALGLPRRDALILAALAALAVAGVALLTRPTVVPFLGRAALIFAGVGGAALVARATAARVALAALVALVALSGLIWPSWLSDDAFISFRYAQNLVEGHGLVYNLGERVEGYTNFLWTVLAAGVIAFGGDVALWCHLSGIALGIAIVLLTYLLGARLMAPAWGLVAALIVATSQSVLLYTARGSGLETGLFTLLLLAASERYLAGGRVAAGVLLALAALTRPEGVMVIALTVGHLVLRELLAARAPWPARLSSVIGRRSPLWPLALSFLLIYGPYFLWRLLYYGDLLPNTFYAKAGGGLSQIMRGLAYGGGFALTMGGPLLLLVLLPWLRSWRAALASWRGYLLPLALAYTAYIVAVGGDHFRGERFFVPIIPWIAILLADGIALAGGSALAARSPVRPFAPSFRVFPFEISNLRFAFFARLRVFRDPKPLLALLLVLGSVAALARTTPDNATIQGLDESVWIWRELGWWMADHTPPGASLAAAGAGAPAFYGRRETIDLYGLTDKHIGRLEVEGMGQGVAGHEKRDPAYVLDERRPTYIPRIWDEYFGGPAALRDRYRLIVVTTRTGRAVQLWERLDAEGRER